MLYANRYIRLQCWLTPPALQVRQRDNVLPLDVPVISVITAKQGFGCDQEEGGLWGCAIFNRLKLESKIMCGRKID